MRERTLPQRRRRAEERAQPLARELDDAAAQHQAEQLADFVVRGGSASRWLDSKDFASGDRAAVLLAAADLLDEGGTAAA